MAQKNSRKTRRAARGQVKKQRYMMIAGFIGVLLVMAAAFTLLRGQYPGAESATGELSTAPTVGALAPDFQLISSKGEQVQLSDFRGQPVAVTFMHTW